VLGGRPAESSRPCIQYKSASTASSLHPRLSTRHCPHLLPSAVLLLPGARRCRSIRPARGALSSKPADARRSRSRMMGQTDRRTDGQTDGRTPDRYIDHAAHAAQAGSINKAFSIGVNAARVQGSRPPPQIFDLQGSSCVDDRAIFWLIY